MNEKMKAWINSGAKRDIFTKNMFVVLATLLIIYWLGYGVGVFWAHIGL